MHAARHKKIGQSVRTYFFSVSDLESHRLVGFLPYIWSKLRFGPHAVRIHPVARAVGGQDSLRRRLGAQGCHGLRRDIWHREGAGASLPDPRALYQSGAPPDLRAGLRERTAYLAGGCATRLRRRCKPFAPPLRQNSYRRGVLVKLTILAVFLDRKSTRLNSSHLGISYAVFCLK